MSNQVTREAHQILSSVSPLVSVKLRVRLRNGRSNSNLSKISQDELSASTTVREIHKVFCEKQYVTSLFIIPGTQGEVGFHKPVRSEWPHGVRRLEKSLVLQF